MFKDQVEKLEKGLKIAQMTLVLYLNWPVFEITYCRKYFKFKIASSVDLVLH